ncbi:hypothetical protein [Hoeflea sp.]|uniref:hypothetical protein n=1 Tax=Hyphomicrobiales TaxID=356 RepID=UPI003A8D6248
MGGWLENLPDATIPAWLGFILSMSLAIIKVWELWQGRFKVDVSGSFTSAYDIGNTIYIRNLSPYAVILTHWEIYYARRFWPFSQREVAADRDFDAGDTTIEKASSYSLTFANEEYFSTSHKRLNGRSLYVKLHFAGRKPVRRRIYPF